MFVCVCVCVCLCVCVFACAHTTDVYDWVCVGMRLCVSIACTFQIHACVFGFEVAAPCQPASSTLRASHSRASVPRGRGWENMRGESSKEQEGDPAYLLPAADRSPLVQGKHPKYDTFNICFGSGHVVR